MSWLQTLAAEFAITVADGSVWLAIGQGLLFGAVCLLFGVWIARFVGLLSADAPAGETLGVGLASGLLVLAAWWAAVASGGRSSFTPVAVGFAIALGLAAVRRWRRRSDGKADHASSGTLAEGSEADSSVRRQDLIVSVLGGALFVVAVALLYGSTLAPSPRAGVQPIEFRDAPFYSTLGADLAKTGTETIYSPSGFDQLDGLPTQTWYHWGELWLAAAAISIFGVSPLEARHFIVLPLLVLAAAALTGTLVRRMTGARSRGAFLFGFLACLFLAPVALIPGPHFSSWAVGLIFGITSYGLAAVAVLLVLHGLSVLGGQEASWPLAIFAASATALLVPAHVEIALLGLVGVGVVWAFRTAQSLAGTRRLPAVAPMWRRTIIATAVLTVATVIWGFLTAHGTVSTGATPGVTPFNASWSESVAIIAVGAGAFLTIPIAWIMTRKEASIPADLYLGTAAILVAGIVIWGALLANIFTFHVFFAGIAVFATPVAAVAAWAVWSRLSATGHRRVAIGVLVLCCLQLEGGVALSIIRLQGFGPGLYPPVPVSILNAIEDLPPDAKLAYACHPLEEVAFWNSGLQGVGTHAGRPIVPMCFQAEAFGPLIGVPVSAEAMSPRFLLAPQRSLYPTATAKPSSESVSSFLREHGIAYIYTDAIHPNTLVPGAVRIATSGETAILRLP